MGHNMESALNQTQNRYHWLCIHVHVARVHVHVVKVMYPHACGCLPYEEFGSVLWAPSSEQDIAMCYGPRCKIIDHSGESHKIHLKT